MLYFNFSLYTIYVNIKCYRTLLNKVAEILPGELKNVAPEETYNVGKHPESAALTVSGGTVTVSVTLTSPLMRETPKSTATAGEFIVSHFYRGQEKDNYNESKVEFFSGIMHPLYFRVVFFSIYFCSFTYLVCSFHGPEDFL